MIVKVSAKVGEEFMFLRPGTASGQAGYSRHDAGRRKQPECAQERSSNNMTESHEKERNAQFRYAQVTQETHRVTSGVESEMHRNTCA